MTDDPGDPDAPDDPPSRDALVEEHLALAHRLARRFTGRGAELDDLEQVAALALVKAADRFDPDYGVAFATFGARTVEGELKRHLRDHGWSVRPPRRTQELVLAVRRAEDDLRVELERAPTIREIAGRTGLTTDEVLEAREAVPARRAASLDVPTGADEPGPRLSPAATGRPDTGFDRIEVRLVVQHLVADLDDTDRRLIEARFFERRSQQEIADEFGVSQSYLSRLLRKILRELRERLDAP